MTLSGTFKVSSSEIKVPEQRISDLKFENRKLELWSNHAKPKTSSLKIASRQAAGSRCAADTADSRLS